MRVWRGREKGCQYDLLLSYRVVVTLYRVRYATVTMKYASVRPKQ